MTKKEYLKRAAELGIPKQEAMDQWDFEQHLIEADADLDEDLNDLDLEDVSDRYGD